MRPKKSLGQCFLINKGAAQRIASLIEPASSDNILEIGGGQGELTRWLVASGAQTYVVELDRDLAPRLREKFADNDNFHLIEGSILDVDPAKLIESSTQFKLIGNIPYHLTGEIVEWTVRYRESFTDAAFTVQKEVGQRLVAQPGNKQFGSLSVLLQTSFSGSRAFDLKPGSFFPPPQVSSTVVKFKRLPEYLIEMDELSDLQRLLRAAFRWRRKQIVNILKAEYDLTSTVVGELLDGVAIAANLRPEQLAVADFVRLLRRLVCLVRGSG